MNDESIELKDLHERTVINFLEGSNNNNWELNLVDPLAINNINRRCVEHPQNEVYLNVREWTTEYDRHWFVGDNFKSKDYCFDCSREKLDSLNNNEDLAKYIRDGEGKIKVSKLSYSDERARLINPYISKILISKSDYLKVMNKKKII